MPASLINGTPTAANVELKCFDLSANPYLVVGAVTAVACAAVDQGSRLPAEVTVDPASLAPADQPPRLPESLGEAVEALVGDAIVRGAMGPVLFDAFVAVRRGEVERSAGRSDDDVVAATRWVH